MRTNASERIRLAKSAMESVPPTQAKLKEILIYLPETGEFDLLKRRGVTPRRTRGSLNPKGAYVLRIDYKLFYAHRIAWLYMTGEWPPLGVDHEDVDPQNNKWENLRECNQSQNSANSRKRVDGLSSSYKGVCWHAAAEKWMAQIVCNGRRYYLGLFDIESDAAQAYVDAAAKFFGEFARAA